MSLTSSGLVTMPDEWRRQVQRFAEYRWAGDIELGTCARKPPHGGRTRGRGKPRLIARWLRSSNQCCTWFNQDAYVA